MAISTKQLAREILKILEEGKEISTAQLQEKYGVSVDEIDQAFKSLGKVEEVKEKKEEEKVLETPLDRFLNVILERGSVPLPELAGLFGVEKEIIEGWVRLLEKQGLVELVFPANVFSNPNISIGPNRPITPKMPRVEKIKKLLRSYTVDADKVPVRVDIYDIEREVQPIYSIHPPLLGPATSFALDSFLDELAEKINVQSEELTDPAKLAALQNTFLQVAEAELSKRIPNLDESKRKILTGTLLHKAFGLGELELLMADDLLEEVAVSSSRTPVAVYHRNYGWMKTTLMIASEDETYNYAAQVGRKVGRQITTLSPLMDAHLLTGDRVNATMFPISTRGNTLTVRKFARSPWTIIDFIDPKRNTISKEIAALLWLAMEYELNVLVAGGTASGKTSLLNSLCALIPPSQRIVTIEDTRELQLPKYLEWNWIPLVTRAPNPEGKGEVSMLDLMITSLRMRPDRIVLGEIRRRPEAEVLFEAMHTGHSVYSTLHADTVEQVYRRLVEPPIAVPESELEALQLIVTQFRDRRKGVRRTFQLAETVSGGYERKISFNILYRWIARDDIFEKANESTRVLNELNMHTGLTLEEIKKDIMQKENILQWMLDNGLHEIDQVGEVMRAYYKNPEIIVEASEKNKKPEQVL